MINVNNFDLFDFHNIYKSQLLLSYKGPMDEYIIHSVGNYIKDLSFKNNNNQAKLFKIYMELIQNVSFYSLESKEYNNGKKVGIGSLVIYKIDNIFFMNIGNIVNKKEINPIINKCEKINKMNREELRNFRRKEINRPYSSSGGGNIGLIQVALTSDNPLNYKLTEIDNNTAFFAVCVKIKG